MNSPQYRVFVCTKQREPNHPEGCCHNCGGMEIYQAFQKEIKQHKLENNVEIRPSGCLDCCEAGAVALICQPKKQDLSWLPTKVRVKLRKLLFANKSMYGNLTPKDVSAIVESHLVKGKPLKRAQI